MRTETRTTSVVESSMGSPMVPLNTVTSSKPGLRHPLAARFALFLLLSTGGLVWDLWSKWSVFNWLKCPGQFSVWKGTLLGVPIDFELATTFNHGALWGIGQGQTWLFATLSIFAIGVIAYFLWTGQALESWWLTVASGLLLAGTMGNLYDRLGLHGWKDNHGTSVYAVRDFLDFVFFNGGFHWATFNFADSFLVVGAIMLVLQSFTQPTSTEPVNACPSACP
jgi:signal peptidase II